MHKHLLNWNAIRIVKESSDHGRIDADENCVEGDANQDEPGRPTMAQERPADRQQHAGEDGDVEAAYSTANRTLNSK